MPRVARQIAASSYYHVIMRGNGKRILFESDSDRLYFLELLERYGSEYGIEYLAWCLMDNHVHLLICDPLRKMDKAMHDIGCVFAQHYNYNNEHCGSVFQGRYTSIPIETNQYLLEVMRYIHVNPVRAKLSCSLDYRWSSYGDYLNGGSFTSTAMILEMLGGMEAFVSFCSQQREDIFQLIDRADSKRFPDSEALSIAKQILGTSLFSKLDRIGKQDRDDCLVALSRAGIPARQIARITGIGRGIVQRACAGTDFANVSFERVICTRPQ